MDEVLQTNIFFYITSVAVVLVTILVAAILVYVFLIVRNIRDLTERFKKGAELIEGDLGEFRDVVKEEGARVRTIVQFFLGKVTPSKRRRKKKEDKEDSG